MYVCAERERERERERETERERFGVFRENRSLVKLIDLGIY